MIFINFLSIYFQCQHPVVHRNPDRVGHEVPRVAGFRSPGSGRKVKTHAQKRTLKKTHAQKTHDKKCKLKAASSKTQRQNASSKLIRSRSELKK
jgi:hypothetical protein